MRSAGRTRFRTYSRVRTRVRLYSTILEMPVAFATTGFVTFGPQPALVAGGVQHQTKGDTINNCLLYHSSSLLPRHYFPAGDHAKY